LYKPFCFYEGAWLLRALSQFLLYAHTLHFANSLRIILSFLEDHCGWFTVNFDDLYYCTMKEYRKNKMTVV